jgi:hypothetical protein
LPLFTYCTWLGRITYTTPVVKGRTPAAGLATGEPLPGGTFRVWGWVLRLRLLKACTDSLLP